MAGVFRSIHGQLSRMGGGGGGGHHGHSRSAPSSPTPAARRRGGADGLVSSSSSSRPNAVTNSISRVQNEHFERFSEYDDLHFRRVESRNKVSRGSVAKKVNKGENEGRGEVAQLGGSGWGLKRTGSKKDVKSTDAERPSSRSRSKSKSSKSGRSKSQRDLGTGGSADGPRSPPSPGPLTRAGGERGSSGSRSARNVLSPQRSRSLVRRLTHKSSKSSKSKSSRRKKREDSSGGAGGGARGSGGGGGNAASSAIRGADSAIRSAAAAVVLAASGVPKTVGGEGTRVEEPAVAMGGGAADEVDGAAMPAGASGDLECAVGALAAEAHEAQEAARKKEQDEEEADRAAWREYDEAEEEEARRRRQRRRERRRRRKAAMSSAGNGAGSKLEPSDRDSRSLQSYIQRHNRRRCGAVGAAAKAAGDDCGGSAVSVPEMSDSEAFDEALSGGMVWTEISRGGKISCVALGLGATESSASASLPSAPPNSPSRKRPSARRGGDGGRAYRSDSGSAWRPTLLAIGTDDGFVSVTELLDGASGRRQRGPNGGKKYGRIRELPREGKVRSLHFSPCGRYLASGGDDCVASVIDLGLYPDPDPDPDTAAGDAEEGDGRPSSMPLPPLRVVRELEREDKVYSVNFSPDGRLLAAGGFDGNAAIASVVDLPRTDRSSDPADSEAMHAAVRSMELVAEVSRPGLVLSVDWHPDGTKLALGGSDRTAAVVDASEWYEDLEDCNDNDNSTRLSRSNSSRAGLSAALAGYEVLGEVRRAASIQSVRWSPDGKKLAMGAHDGVVAIVDVEGRCIVGEIDRSGGRDGAADGKGKESSHAGSALADLQSFGGGGSIATASTKYSAGSGESAGSGGGGKRKGDPSRKGCRVTALTWSPDGTFLAVGTADGSCGLIEAKTSFRAVHEMRRRGGKVRCASWCDGGASGGQYLAVGGDDRSVSILKTGGGGTGRGGNVDGGYASESSGVFSGYSDAESSIASLASTATGLSAASNEWALKADRFRDTPRLTGDRKLEPLDPPEKKDDDAVKIHSVAFSASANSASAKSEYMAVSGSDGRVAIVCTEEWCTLSECEFSVPINSLAFSNTNRYLALGSSDSVAYVVSVHTWEPLSEVPVSSPVQCLSFSAGDERLAVGTEDGTLEMLWRVDNHHADHGDSGDVGDSSKWDVAGEMDESESPVLAVDWSSDGKHFAVGRNDASITVHESANVFENFFVAPTELRRRNGAPVRAVKFGGGGKFLAAGGGDWMVAIYRAKGKSWGLVHELRMDGWVTSLGWSPDGRYVAVGTTDSSTGGKVLDTISWDPVEELDSNDVGAGEEITCLDWSDDRRWLVLAGTGGVSTVVDAAAWSVARKLEHKSPPEEDAAANASYRPPHDEEADEAASLPVPLVNINRPGTEKAARLKEEVEDPTVPSSEFTEQLRDIMVSCSSVVSDLQMVGAESVVSDPQQETDRRRSSANNRTDSLRSLKRTNSRGSPPVTQTGSLRKQLSPSLSRASLLSNNSSTNDRDRAGGAPSWEEHKTIRKFMAVSDSFLGCYETKEPPHELRLFVPLIQLIQIHVQWVCAATDSATRKSLALRDGGKVFDAFRRVLSSAAAVMERALRDEGAIEEWWEMTRKFDLSPEDLDRIDEWNETWLQFDACAPVIDLALMKVSDLPGAPSLGQ